MEKKRSAGKALAEAGSKPPRRSRRRQAPRRLAWAAGAVVLVTAAMVLVPDVAYADVVTNAVNNWLTGVLTDAYNMIFEKMGELSSMMVTSTPIDASFDMLFGTSSAGPGLFTVVTGIADAVIKPIAHSILAGVMLLQLVKISQKYDGSQAISIVRDVGMLLIFCTVFVMLINHSTEICMFAYEVTRSMIKGIVAWAAGNTIAMDTQSVISNAFIPSDTSAMAVSELGIFTVLALICFIGMLASLLIQIFAVYTRALQIYIMTAFASLPLALLGFEETKSWAIGFFRNFLSVCLAGVIMVLITIMFPYALAGVVGMSFTMLGGTLQNALRVLSVLVITIVMAFAMLKAGTLAKSILGT